MLFVIVAFLGTIGAFFGGVYGAGIYSVLHENSTALLNSPNVSTLLISVIAAYAAYTIFVPITNHFAVAMLQSHFEETIVTF